MRIAVWHNLPSGGGKRALYDHVRGLAARGHDVEVWCPPTASRTFLPLDTLVREHVVDMQWPLRERRSDRWQITLHAERSIAAMDAHCRSCADEIGRGGFDVLFANSCQFFRTTSIGRFATIPSVLYLQEPYRWLYEALPRLCWLAPPRRPGPLRLATARAAFTDLRANRNLRLQAREEVDNAAAFDRILVNSYFSRESVLRAYGQDLDVCYLGIDLAHFALSERPRTDHVIGLGAITYEKNVGLCIEAIGAIPEPRPKLIWIGNVAVPGYLDAMRALAKSLHVEFDPRVGVTDAEVLDVMGTAIAMVYAPRLEPFGLAPLEANACGVPVVAVAEGGVRETVVDGVTGLLVAHDPSEMASAIGRIRNDPALGRQLGSNGRRAVEAKWSFDAAVDRLEQRLQRHALQR